MATCGIYALVDPRTNKIRYIGQSISIESRFRQHCDPATSQSNIPKALWVSELIGLQLMPRLLVLQIHNPLAPWEMDRAEKKIIAEHRRKGECDLNIAVGGKCRNGSRFLMSSDRQWFDLAVKLRQFDMKAYETYKALEAVCGVAKAGFFYRIVGSTRAALAKAEVMAEKAMGNDYGAIWFETTRPLPTEADWEKYVLLAHSE